MLFATRLTADPVSGQDQLEMHRAWFAGLKESAFYLEERWLAEVGRPLPAVPFAYRPLMRFALAHAHSKDRVEPPNWLHATVHGELPVNPAGARLLDGVLALVAGSMEREVAAPWELRATNDTGQDWALHRGPVLSATLPLVSVVSVLVGISNPARLDRLVGNYSRYWGMEYRDDLVAGKYFAVDEDIDAFTPADWTLSLPQGSVAWPVEPIQLVTFDELLGRASPPRAKDLVVRVIMRGDDSEWDQILADEFTHVVEVQRELDLAIGEDARAELEDTLLAEDGIIATSGEDREWLYLNAPGLSRAQMLTLVRRVVTRLEREHSKK